MAFKPLGAYSMPNTTQSIYYRKGSLALCITLAGEDVMRIEFIHPQDPQIDLGIKHPYLAKVDDYICGKSNNLELPYLLDTTVFRAKVYEVVRKIPHGKTLSYSKVAAQSGSPGAARAVGAAMAANPLPLIIPCHRVVGSDGKLTGFRGGLNIKEMLLELEGNR